MGRLSGFFSVYNFVLLNLKYLNGIFKCSAPLPLVQNHLVRLKQYCFVVVCLFIYFVIASKPKTRERLGVGPDRRGLLAAKHTFLTHVGAVFRCGCCAFTSPPSSISITMKHFHTNVLAFPGFISRPESKVTKMRSICPNKRFCVSNYLLL